ncbi:MAG: response regulator transcription factor [Lachnospiraceae bacterium]|nr:response regulator transcription factor [Lachnospiraceae bacterium]
MKIVIIDDDDIVLMSLKTIIEASGIEVLATGRCGEDAIALYESFKPDILLSDIRMNGMTGIEAAGEITKKHDAAKILFLTTFSDDEYVVEALKCGAKGYILKQDFEGIIPALNAVYSGQSVFGGEIVNKLPSINSSEYLSREYEEKNITDKEYNIITLAAEGLNNKEIAEKMYLSEGTVRNYLSNILEKLELRDRTQLVVYYYRHR